MNSNTKMHVLNHLAQLGKVVSSFSALYEQHPELNDEINIANIIPMSMDEWALEISKKIHEIARIKTY